MITAPKVLAGNILTAADSLFPTTASTTWTATTNASVPTVSGANYFVGPYALAWTAPTAADTIISTGYYPCVGFNGYDYSGFVITPAAAHDTYIGVNFYTSSHTFMTTQWGADNPSVANVWQPFVLAATAPPLAAYFTVSVWVGTGVSAGEAFAIDLMYAADVPAQILVDWYNPAFAQGAIAGTDFMDLTPWVRFDQNITTSRGRQDAVSEIQAGQATFQLQNDNGWFTPQNTNSPFFPNVSLGCRTQVNTVDQLGVWYTRFDGGIAEITYEVDTTGNTNVASVSASDVLAVLNRQNQMACWTKSVVMHDNPWLHWSLNDKGDTLTGAETSGNNGPIMHAVNFPTATPIAWQNSNGGVETLANNPKVGLPNGEEYWTPGSVIPSSAVRGLDSGVVGPISTPLSSTYFTLAYTAGSTQNTFTSNGGGQLNAELYLGGLPAPIQANNPNNSYSVECWFAQDPNISAAARANQKAGPYIAISLGSSRTGGCLCAGMYLNGTSYQFRVATYAQPPAFSELQFSQVPTALQTCSETIPLENSPIPHHLVLNIQGSGVGGVVTAYLDHVNIGSITLTPTQVFDQVCVGGAFGGYGAFFGNVQLVSIYQYALSTAQIIQHCSVGQYGYWEQTTDNAIAELAQLAGIPKYWNNLTGNYAGLTLADYQDATGTTALGNMQLYEQAERGLLFVNVLGQLSFDTRDWRMGYGAPDLAIPPGIYNADLGYELVDTFLLNEASTGTATFSEGTAWQSQSSENQYGVYANGTASSPIQLPLITCSRAYTELGLSQYGFWPDPALNDVSSWQINTRNQPRMISGGLTIDLLSLGLNNPVGIANLYAVDIDNMVTLTGLPSSLPNVSGSTDLFVEGINEVIGIATHTLVLYTSPASSQRAWRPGDATYGALGTTTRLGVSAPDVSITPACGKAVAHDAGGPFWPPIFDGGRAANYWSFEDGTLDSWVGYNGTVTNTTTWATNGTHALSIAYTGLGEPRITSPSFTVTPGAPLTASADVWATQTLNNATIIVDWYNLAGVWQSSSQAPQVVITAGTFQTLSEIVTVPQQVYSATVSVSDLETTLASSNAYSIDNVNIPAVGSVMNNPAANGHAFVGGADIRGLHDNLSTALAPPMLVVGAVNHTQTIGSGNVGLASARILFDTVYVDTAGGMGVVNGWPDWYCCMTPGFYEIDSTVEWQTESSAAGERAGWIIIAQAAAQAVAAGTGTPTTVNQYVCPIGEQIPANAGSMNSVANASTRIYLGLGDMVCLGGWQNSGGNKNTGGWPYKGATLSLRWVGFSTLGDQQPITQSPGNGMYGAPPSKGGGNPTTTTTGYWSGQYTYAYFGAGAAYGDGNKLADFGHGITQGKYQNGVNGSCYGVVLFNYQNMHSVLSGRTINWMQCKATNTHSWYNSGCKLMLGTTSITNNGTWANMRPGTWTWYDETEISFKENQTKWFNIPVRYFGSLGSSTVGLVIGNNSTTNLEYYSTWGTGPGSWELAINYT